MLSVLLIYVVLGLFVGLLAGLLGVGGGIVLVPALLIIFPYQGFTPDVTMHMALGTSMASIIFTSISSSRAHYQRGGVDTAFVRTIVPGLLIGTYSGSLFVSYLPAKTLQLIFLVFLCFIAAQMLFGKKPTASRQLPSRLKVNAAGFCIGTLSSFVGVGGGTMSVPYMLWHNVPMHKAIGTSAAIGFFIAVAGTFGYLTGGGAVPNLPEYSVGYIYLPALVCLVSTSMLVAPLGTRLSHTLPVDKLKKCFAVLLVVMAVRMLFSVIY